jgi:hypothetical protein
MLKDTIQLDISNATVEAPAKSELLDIGGYKWWVNVRRNKQNVIRYLFDAFVLILGRSSALTTIHPTVSKSLAIHIALTAYGLQSQVQH